MQLFLEYESVKDNLVKYKCLSCNKDYSNKNPFKNTFKFSNNDINKFILLLRKGVYPYEYMDDWEKFNETTLPGKEEFYSNLNTEEITDAHCYLLFTVQIIIYRLLYIVTDCYDIEKYLVKILK